jgi:hypothetical protein
MKIFRLVTMISIPFFAHAQAPQIAIDACKNAIAESRCSFNSPHGKVAGSCLDPAKEKQLVCVPEKNLNRPLLGGKQSQRPQSRQHTIVQSDGKIETIKADIKPISENRIKVSINGNQRILNANGISKHLTGKFPNAGNPNSIKEQKYIFKIPVNPKIAANPTPLGMYDFGLGINGIPFDPAAAEWYLGDRQSGWQYEAMSGAIILGLDENHAHVQPTGAYHYHAMPTLLVLGLELLSTAHSPLVGWAADGFPIYALYGYKEPNEENSGIIENTSSYRLKKGKRPVGGNNPSGNYDGTFVVDYEYVEGTGSLDECNGRITRTPELRDGTYAYFLTKSFPIIPRCYKGTPSTDFTLQRAR